MGRNIEIKARIADRPAVQARVAALADRDPEALHQDDRVFPCRDSRLKWRNFGDGNGELIHTRRSDWHEPEESDYLIAPTADPESLAELLSRRFGERGVVRRMRTAYFVGQTRIHLDVVEGLADFLELEFVLSPGQNRDDSSLASGGISLATLSSCSMSETMQGSAFVDGRPLISKTRSHAFWSNTETARA